MSERAESRAPRGQSNGAEDREGAILREVQRALREIQFGSVLIKIHQGEVVGLETSTKVRLDRSSA